LGGRVKSDESPGGTKMAMPWRARVFFGLDQRDGHRLGPGMDLHAENVIHFSARAAADRRSVTGTKPEGRLGRDLRLQGDGDDRCHGEFALHRELADNPFDLRRAEL
jgi:hypothetical protein